MELPVFSSPIKGRLDITYALHSILNHQDGEDFLYNYFVNTECLLQAETKDINYNFLGQLARNDKSYIHYLNEFYEIEEFAKGKNVVDEIASEINAGYYVYICFDDYYLENKLAYKKEHYEHINFIYGYDKQSKKLLALGYNVKGNYVSMEIGYEEAKEAYEACSLKIVDIFRPNKKKRFVFDRQQLVLQLEDYLNGENRLVSLEDLHYFEIDKTKFAYGVSTNNHICVHLEKVRTGEVEYDNRNLYLLWEHKKLMVKRIEYLKTHQGISGLQIESFIEIKTQVQRAKNLMFKWEIKKEKQIVDMVIEILNDIFEREIVAVKQLITRLTSFG